MHDTNRALLFYGKDEALLQRNLFEQLFVEHEALNSAHNVMIVVKLYVRSALIDTRQQVASIHNPARLITALCLDDSGDKLHMIERKRPERVFPDDYEIQL